MTRRLLRVLETELPIIANHETEDYFFKDKVAKQKYHSSYRGGRISTGYDYGLITKAPNPYDRDELFINFYGLHTEGTAVPARALVTPGVWHGLWRGLRRHEFFQCVMKIRVVEEQSFPDSIVAWYPMVLDVQSGRLQIIERNNKESHDSPTKE